MCSFNPSKERTAAAALRAASTPQGSAQQRHHCVQLQPFRGAHSGGSTACSFNPSGERTAAAPLRAASTLQGSALRAAQPQQRAAQPRRRAHNSACSSTPRRAAPVRAAPPRRGAHSIAHGANADVSTHFCICKSTMLNMDCSNAMFGLLPLSGSGGGSGPLPPNGLCAGSGGEGDERRRLGRARVAAFLLRSSTRAGGSTEVFLARCCAPRRVAWPEPCSYSAQARWDKTSAWL